jgi:L-fucose isomerase-like protein
MLSSQRIILGYAPTRRDFLPNPQEINVRKDAIRKRVDMLVEKSTDLELVDIDWLNDEGLLYCAEDIEKVASFFLQKKVDAIFMPHCNFGQEEVVGQLGKIMNVPVLLWGPRDDAPPKGFAPRPTDTQCGLFASSRALLRCGVTFTYIENCWLDDLVLDKEFDDFIRCVSVVKAFNNMRIGKISVRPRQFHSLKINASELTEKFGIDVVAINDMEVLSLIKQILQNKTDEVDHVVREIESSVDCTTMAKDACFREGIDGLNAFMNCTGVMDTDIIKYTPMQRIAASEMMLFEIAQRYGLSAIASDCWMLFSGALGIMPCFAYGDVTDKGLPVICETDIHGAITSVLLGAAARGRSPAFIADLTIRHPENDNAELLWHRGPFPKSLAKRGVKPVLTECHGQWELAGGDITLARFEGHRGEYKLFADHARGVDGPNTNGNYLWVEVDDWVKWEKKLIYGPYIHHMSGIHGKYADILHQACRYMNHVEADFV